MINIPIIKTFKGTLRCLLVNKPHNSVRLRGAPITIIKLKHIPNIWKYKHFPLELHSLVMLILLVLFNILFIKFEMYLCFFYKKKMKREKIITLPFFIKIRNKAAQLICIMLIRCDFLNRINDNFNYLRITHPFYFIIILFNINLVLY